MGANTKTIRMTKKQRKNQLKRSTSVSVVSPPSFQVSSDNEDLNCEKEITELPQEEVVHFDPEDLYRLINVTVNNDPRRKATIGAHYFPFLF